MNEKGRCLMEIDDLDQIKDQPWIEFWSHDQRPAVQQAMDAARSGGVGRFDGYRPTLNGTPQWWDVVVEPDAGRGRDAYTSRGGLPRRDHSTASGRGG